MVNRNKSKRDFGGDTFIELKGGIVEFLPNGKSRFYTGNGEYLEREYRIDHDFLYQSDITDEAIIGGKWTYKYLF